MFKKTREFYNRERVHNVINDMIRTDYLYNYDFDPVNPWGDIISNVSWGLCSLFHIMLYTTPGQLV